MAGDDRPAALLIGGPTASGKTALALEIARQWGAVIVSADAMQVYRGMDIGTAKPSAAERAAVPHVGIDVVDPHEPFDAAAFVALADAALQGDRPVIVAGGTSLYLHALVRGLVHTPDADPVLRAEILAGGDLHRRLAKVDPILAARVHPHDTVRLVRGLEVHAQTGTPLSALQAAHADAPDRLRAHTLWLDARDLTERIDARVHAMIAAGYVDEVRALLDRGVDRTLKPMQSLGYRHLADHVLDGLPLDEAVRRTQRDTRRFARRQRTWHNTLGWPVVSGEAARETAITAAVACFGRAA